MLNEFLKEHRKVEQQQATIRSAAQKLATASYGKHNDADQNRCP
jgi:hypothetical protein